MIKIQSFIIFFFLITSSLDSLLLKISKFDEKFVKKIVYQLIKALDCLHKATNYHGNFYPKNILINSKLKVKIKSFVNVPTSLIITKEFTKENYDYHYYSPNLFNAGEKTYSDDIWALGCITIELLIGKLPWQELKYYDLANRLKKNQPFKLPSNLSEFCVDFINICMNKDEKLKITTEELLKHPFILNNE